MAVYRGRATPPQISCLHINCNWHLRRESVVKGVHQLAEREGEVLVEEVAHVFTRANVRPAAVNEQQTLEERELRQREVTRQNRLITFLTTQTNADVRLYTMFNPAIPTNSIFNFCYYRHQKKYFFCICWSVC